MKQNQINLTELKKMFEDLADHHWACSSSIFSFEFNRSLAQECQTLISRDEFKKASIGHGERKAVHAEIRGDNTFWLSADSTSSVQAEFWDQLNILQAQLNEWFFLNLKRFEAHFAQYPVGAGYEKHVDNRHNSGARKITFILYLNDQWQLGDGGELSIYDPVDNFKLLAQVQPKLGTFVLFRSDVFPHQVEKNMKPRLSLTGWFRDDAL